MNNCFMGLASMKIEGKMKAEHCSVFGCAKNLRFSKNVKINLDQKERCW